MLRITLIILSLLIFLQLHLQHQLPIIISLFYLGINLITFIFYAFDKSAARKGNWRIKESYLHLLALSGGWWAGLIAQQFIRHKSVKKPFLVIFNITLFTNVSLLILFFY